jgi:hypothetical protein
VFCAPAGEVLPAPDENTRAADGVGRKLEVMRRMRERLVMLMTASFLALAIPQAEPSAALVVGVAIIAVGALLVARVAVGVAGAHELRVGARAREHRELLGALPEPQHPDTDGRPRSRAPSRVVSATPSFVE